MDKISQQIKKTESVNERNTRIAHFQNLWRLNENNLTFSFTNLEPYIGDASLGAEKIKRLDTRCSLHFHSRRYRLTDPDGLSAKAVIDGLVLAGILSDDTTKQIKQVTFSQEKISKKEKEITIVEIIPEK